MSMNVVAFIFARGGSKGLPGKNVRPLCGKPMIAWAIEQAKAVKSISRVIVSTDSEEIAIVARQYGAETPFLRPHELARDDSPEWLAWRHALSYLQNEGDLPDAMVSIPVTAPLRQPIDIERCLDDFARGGADVVVTVSTAHRSPYFNMVKRNGDGTVELVIPPVENVSRRQDAPLVFDMATVAYVVSPEFVLTRNALFEGRVRAVEVPLERAIDIDTYLDFQIAECLMKAINHDHT
jgi:CMP-N-acetylneuraminic acid synthetase